MLYVTLTELDLLQMEIFYYLLSVLIFVATLPISQHYHYGIHCHHTSNNALLLVYLKNN